MILSPKAIWILLAAVLLAIWVTAFTMRTSKGKPEPFALSILGKSNRVYLVYGSSMQNASGMAVVGNNQARTVVVIKCPVYLQIRGSENVVMIDKELRETVHVEDHGIANVYAFSD